jgi:hypothetical protein
MRRSNMLFAKANFSLCALNNKLYSFGGITLNEERIDIVECYDIAENVWIYIGTMPSPFVAGSVVAYHNAFFIMGGRVGVGNSDTSITILIAYTHHDCLWAFLRHNLKDE